MVRLRTALFTIALVPLAPGCSSEQSQHAGDVAKPIAAEPEPGAGAKDEAAVEADERPLRPEPEAPPSASMAEESKSSKTAEIPSDGGGGRAEAGLAQVGIAEPAINGGLNRDIIRRRAQDHSADIRACYERELAGAPELAGSVIVELEVDARGVVKDVELGDDSSIGDREVETCVLEHVATWSFAGEATSKATVELRFDLAPPR